MSTAGEVDSDLVPFNWHWLLFPLVDMAGPELVYSAGLETLGYPPTWADTQEEADTVEASVIRFLDSECKTHGY